MGNVSWKISPYRFLLWLMASMDMGKRLLAFFEKRKQ